MSSTLCDNKLVPGELYRLKEETSVFGPIVAIPFPRRACNYGFINSPNPCGEIGLDDDDIDVLMTELVLCIAAMPCQCVKTGWKKKKYDFVYMMLAHDGIIETHETSMWVKA